MSEKGVTHFKGEPTSYPKTLHPKPINNRHSYPTTISYWLTPEYYEKYADGKHHATAITIDEGGGFHMYVDGEEIPSEPYFRLSPTTVKRDET